MRNKWKAAPEACEASKRCNDWCWVNGVLHKLSPKSHDCSSWKTARRCFQINEKLRILFDPLNQNIYRKISQTCSHFSTSLLQKVKQFSRLRITLRQKFYFSILGTHLSLHQRHHRVMGVHFSEHRLSKLRLELSGGNASQSWLAVLERGAPRARFGLLQCQNSAWLPRILEVFSFPTVPDCSSYKSLQLNVFPSLSVDNDEEIVRGDFI